MLPATRRGRRWALGYLLVVAAVLAFVVATFTVFACEGCGANLSTIWLVLVTAPWSYVALVGSGSIDWWRFVLALVVGAAANAALLGWLGDRHG